MHRRACRALVFLVAAPATLAAQPPPAPVTAAGKEPTLQIGGLIQAQAELGDQGDSRFPSSNDRIYLRRARVNAGGKLLEEFDFRLEVDMAGTLANTTGLRAQLTDGYVTWNRYPAANVRSGQFKAPFGYEQLVGDATLFSLERTLATDRLTPARQLGVQLAGSAIDRRLSYAVGAFNGTGVNNNFNDDSRFLLAGRVSAIPWSGKIAGQEASWSAGAGAYRSEDTSVNLPDFGFDSTPATPDRDSQFGGKRNAWQADTQLVIGPFELWAEVLRARFEPADRLPAPSFDAGGDYLQTTFYVIPQKLQVLLKTERFDPSRSVDGDDTRTDTAGANWYFKGHNLKLMADYLRVDAPRRPTQNKVLARIQVQF
ncbi:MAG TPA: porin [Thermoanaerobaculia bacterium]|jgi:phosphate-selective porin|nr:porin [Thermoanaerobaculia bacterium]